jgi:hypothetical protein
VYIIFVYIIVVFVSNCLIISAVFLSNILNIISVVFKTLYLRNLYMTTTVIFKGLKLSSVLILKAPGNVNRALCSFYGGIFDVKYP